MRTLRIVLVALAALAAGLIVSALVLMASGPTGALPPTTERVSVASDGTEGDEHANGSTISADGRFVVFVSISSNLVPDDTNGHLDVFVRDRQTGTTERVSVDSAGNQGDYNSSVGVISADGRYVAFSSGASNLVPEDTNGQSDIFVHDCQTGTTERVSVDSAGNQADLGSGIPAISADGRYVAFYSWATNLVSGDTNGKHDVFVHDRQTGTTQRVSVDSGGNQANDYSLHSAISADGRYVAFDSPATDLIPGDTNGHWDIFVHDRQTGTTERVSVDTAGNQADDSSVLMYGRGISADGSYVAFASWATNLVSEDTNDMYDAFVHDRQTGTTERVSVDSGGNQASYHSGSAAISADGRYVAFESAAWNLVPGDTNDLQDIFVHDRQTGTTERVSVDSAGAEANKASYGPAISAEGQFVAFHTIASNLVPDDTNGRQDVFVHRLGDADEDGEWDPFDPDDDNDGYWDDDETEKGSLPLDPGSTPEHCDGADNDGDTDTDEGYDRDPANSTPDCEEQTGPDMDGDDFPDAAEQWMSTDELADCVTTYGTDAWPPDFDLDADADIVDVLRFKGPIMTNLGDVRYDKRFDFDADEDVDIVDVLKYKPFILTSCTP